ncbi:MAG: multifunctional CCA tRNA nucleotidyl transferase/2'3'-cyclic phosphodiesterase/2'nucleotidase/phosphatase [Lautropia sp.]|nr:multifunctional CCA tRNA nucleotidyl transferase/2'3'-cyclic phosphodiesterase/2'nucleotidase/phosphatase [Lautropia sp.]
MQCHRVGGSVRDELMGLPAGDRDWVVVGTTPEQMIARGFKPVGKDFPVFLHPHTREEYALARTERKTSPGYHGFEIHFSPDVTLEEDLLRRDLTINAMATPAESGTQTLIDPFNGRQDLQDRIFRHVSPAFREDPVRILRLARFAARFPDFEIADETLDLMRDMSAAGEVNALVPERVWQEVSRGLMSKRPSRMLEVLEQSHALGILLPELPPAQTQLGWLDALDASAAANDPLPVRFAILLAAVHLPASRPPQTEPHAPSHQTGVPDSTPQSAPPHAPAVAAEAIARRLRAPNECIDAAVRLATEMHGPIPVAALTWFANKQSQTPEGLLALFNRHDGWRRPERIAHLLLAARRLCDPAFDSQHGVATRLMAALQAARAIDSGAIAQQHAGDPQQIRHAIDTARLQALYTSLQAPDHSKQT